MRSLSPLKTYTLSAVLTLLTTWGLLLAQTFVAHLEGGHVRPFGIGFLLTVALMTILGGRGPGLFTLGLSAASLMLYLTPLGAGGPTGRPRDWVELLLLLGVGAALIRGLEALRTNARLLTESEQARARLRAVMDTAPVGILLSDLSGGPLYANREAERIWGQTLDSIREQGDADYSIFHLDGSPASSESVGLRRALAGEPGVIHVDVVVAHPDGTRIVVESDSTLVRDDAGRGLSGLVIFSDITERVRTEQEVQRLLDRERTIAVALQDALIPALPKRVPGLVMASYYKAALEEANVGGDFLDVFGLETGSVVFAVGDLSGKGLAAAAQVATVRNMLRYSLYRTPRLDRAISELNQTIVAHDLLSGFATLFVGIYDPPTRVLTYLSCGHDPGLLRRGGGGAIALLPEGGTEVNPVLGLDEDSQFAQQSVTLSPGDMLFFCTDGVTEAGRSRGEFLGVAGVAELLAAGDAEETPEELVARVVAGVRDYAHGVVHDDVCLLAAAVVGD